MHELSYVTKLVDLAVQTAERENMAKITAVYADIGKMTGLVPFYMQKYFKTAVKDTVLDGSKLIINEVAVTAKCSCGHEYAPDASHDYLCPVCGSGQCRIITGREMLLTKLEGECEDER